LFFFFFKIYSQNPAHPVDPLSLMRYLIVWPISTNVHMHLFIACLLLKVTVHRNFCMSLSVSFCDCFSFRFTDYGWFEFSSTTIHL